MILFRILYTLYLFLPNGDLDLMYRTLHALILTKVKLMHAHCCCPHKFLNLNFMFECYEPFEWHSIIRWKELWEVVPEARNRSGDGQHRFGHQYASATRTRKSREGSD